MVASQRPSTRHALLARNLDLIAPGDRHRRMDRVSAHRLHLAGTRRLRSGVNRSDGGSKSEHQQTYGDDREDQSSVSVGVHRILHFSAARSGNCFS